MTKSPTKSQIHRSRGIGIDVSKDTLDVMGSVDDQRWQWTVPNTHTGITRLAKKLVAAGYAGRIVCESTGHYHLLLGLLLAEHGLDLRIVNPLLSSKHFKSRIRKTKTDAQDAYLLCTMCWNEPDLPAAAHLTREQLQMRLKQGQLQSLEKQLQRQKRSAAAYLETNGQLGIASDQSTSLLQGAIDLLSQAHKALSQELEALRMAQMNEQEVTRLRALPGFSQSVSTLVGSSLNRQAASERSWIAYVGLDVSVRQSGTWRGRGKLTKRGNAYLRKRLYHAAWGAMMNNDAVRTYYLKLKEGGRTHTEALCIIARKLLRIAYAVLVRGCEYDEKIAFA